MAQPRHNNLPKELKVMVSDLFKQKERFEKGIVRRLNGSYATVEILRQNSPECTNCSSCAGADDKPQFFEVKAFPGLKAGERVTLQTIGHSPYTGMILIFILPLVSLVIGSFLGRKWHFLYPNSSDVRMISCGFIFFLLSLVAVSIYEKTMRHQKRIGRKIISRDTRDSINLIPG